MLNHIFMHTYLGEESHFHAVVFKRKPGAGKRVKVLAVKHDNLSSIPGTHMVGGETQLLQVVL